MSTSTGILNKKRIGLIVAAVIVIASIFIPGSEALSHEGVLTLGIFAMAAALWICESLPVGVTGLLALTLAVVLGLSPITTVFSGFSAQTIFYLIAAYALTAIFGQTTYGTRIVRFLLKHSRGNAKLIVLWFMVAAAVLSAIMSDTAVVILFLGFAKAICDALGYRPMETNFGRCMFIGLVYGSIIGGFATLSGGTNNILVMDISKLTIGYLDWMKVGIPITVVMVPIAWFFLVHVFRPEDIPEEKAKEIIGIIKDLGPITAFEKKALAYLVALPVLWIAGNWITVLNVTVVALLGLIICFLPSVGLLDWPKYQAAVPWSVLIMVGAIISLSSLLVSTGVPEFITMLFQSTGVFSLPFHLALMIFLFLAYAVFTLCPVGGAWEALFIPVLMSYCVSVGVSPIVAPLSILFAFGGNFLLPINPLNMYSYDYGYFGFNDMLKAGILPAVILIVLDSLWTPWIVAMLGL